MFDPFAAGLEVLFRAPGSAAAVYTPVNGPAANVRVIRSQPDEVVGTGGRQVIESTNSFELRRSEVAEPRKGDYIQIGADAFVIAAKPRLDAEGLTWFCTADPAC